VFTQTFLSNICMTCRVFISTKNNVDKN